MGNAFQTLQPNIAGNPLIFSGFILDRQHGCTGIVTGSNPPRVRQAAAGDDRQRNAARMVIRASCSARQSIGRMSAGQEERCASIGAGQ
jgi:hypothetical protein